MSSAVVPTEISFPMTIGVNGAIQTTTDPAKLAADHITAVLSTRYGERVMRPDYGANLDDALYGYAGIDSDSLASQEVSNSLGRWAPSIEIIDVAVRSNNFDAPLSSTGVDVQFRVKGTRSSTDFNPVFTAQVNLGGTVIESKS